MSKPRIHAAVGLILREDGKVLFGKRPEDKPWPGYWELPGGKVEAGETVSQALRRELKEELDINVTHSTPWIEYVHEYPKNIVRLSFYKVDAWDGEEKGVEGQELTWLTPNWPLSVDPVLPAAEPPMRWLSLPNRYLLSHIGDAAHTDAWLERLETSLEDGIQLVQFREPAWEQLAANDAEQRDMLHQAWLATRELCWKYGARCLINSVHPKDWWSEGDGVQLRASDAQHWATQAQAGLKADTAHADPVLGLPEKALVGVSAHNSADLEAAIQLNASFIVVGHVLPTPSHPGEEGLGWAAFQELAWQAGRPVFAIGGQSNATLAEATEHGAHGIAGIRHIGHNA
ncbi:Nudix family hydrolase [Paenalcaligenes sp. Me131]|uniref:Nudix family hydrolase n=1 Tax=Paenalcaligenes sp. Me131 TaxID=3392636 RepID=UPI003D29B955